MKTHIFLQIVFLIFSTAAAHAESSDTGSKYRTFTERAEKRETQRWTLSEWLEQRDRSRMMDLWLTLNSPTPYEMMLGVSYNSASVETKAIDTNSLLATKTNLSSTSSKGTLAAYAYIFGLTAEYENNTQENYNDLGGLFNLRLFGNSLQSTSLTASYGMQTRTFTQTTPGIRLSRQMAQGTLQLYLSRYFGVLGSYREYFPTTDTTMGDVKGNLVEAQVFIDFKNVRVYGGWFSEKEDQDIPSTKTTTVRTGTRGGLQFYF